MKNFQEKCIQYKWSTDITLEESFVKNRSIRPLSTKTPNNVAGHKRSYTEVMLKINSTYFLKYFTLDSKINTVASLNNEASL